MMHILLVADGRSPITCRWIQTMLAIPCRVSLLSTFPCRPIDNVDLVGILPVAFSSLAGSQVESVSHQQEKTRSRSRLAALRPFLQDLRYFLGPLTLPVYASRFKRIARDLKPDLVHALRIPFEGMLASWLPEEIPLLISTWGNDLTLHARGSILMDTFTRRTLKRADGLISDTLRDIRLAREWGLNPDAPVLEVPGNGGVNLLEIEQLKKKDFPDPEFLKQDSPLIINPRGFRPGSVHQEVFFQSIPLVLKELPKAQFVCTGMIAQKEALHWVNQLGIENSVVLLPYLNQTDLWNLFLRAEVYVSVSSHDGTPNTLLEAMACGCLPVCGDIESVREWITTGENGLLVDPHDPRAVADAIVNACRDKLLQEKSKKLNKEIIRTRAEVSVVRRKADSFYKEFIHRELKNG
jgi:glycosyltransferase involved in cell wall biosynthesis